MSDDLRLNALNERMSCRPAIGDEGTLAATMLTFTDEEASEAAEEIYDINYLAESELDATGDA